MHNASLLIVDHTSSGTGEGDTGAVGRGRRHVAAPLRAAVRDLRGRGCHRPRRHTEIAVNALSAFICLSNNKIAGRMIPFLCVYNVVGLQWRSSTVVDLFKNSMYRLCLEVPGNAS